MTALSVATFPSDRCMIIRPTALDSLYCVAACPRQLYIGVESSKLTYNRGTQREYSSKPLKHSIVKRILVFKR